MPESQIVTSICEYLEVKKHFFWRQNNVSVYDPVGKRFRAMPKFSKKGVPDIIVIWRGYFVGLEVKQKGKYLSKDQKEFRDGVIDAGGEYHLVRSIEDVQEIGL